MLSLTKSLPQSILRIGVTVYLDLLLFCIQHHTCFKFLTILVYIHVVSSDEGWAPRDKTKASKL